MAQSVLFLMGPTATGKTARSIDLAQAFDGEVISVDSALIYRGMDVGTAKPDAAERAGIPHHLIDIRDPAESYSVAEFRADALGLIEEIQARGKLPILAGGTMLYFRALLDGLAQLPEADAEVRRQLEAELSTRGAALLHRALAEVDPAAAERIHVNDPQRLLRALEVYRVSGRPLSEFHREQEAQRFALPHLKLGLIPYDRPRHRELVATRFAQMLEQGFMEEVEKLYQRSDLSLELPSMRSVGYRQAWQYLAGEWDFATMREKAVTATRQLAKRQMTWLRKEPDLQEWDCFELDPASLQRQVEDFLRRC